MSTPGRILFVLGSHRGGTSALTRMLNLMGAKLPQEILPPAVDNNETGFWESTKFVAFNIKLSTLLKSNWASISVSHSEIEDLAEFKQLEFEARDWLRTELRSCENNQFLLLKDPRANRYLEFWMKQSKAIDAEPFFITSVRHPLEVAESLRVRDKFDLNISLMIWLRAYIESEYPTRNCTRAFVDFGQLLRDWKRSATVIENRFDGLRSGPVSKEIGSFLNPAFRHHEIPYEKLLDSNIPSIVRDTYDCLTDLCSNNESTKTLEKMKRLRALLADLDFLVGAYGNSEHKKGVESASEGDLRVLIHALQNEVAELKLSRKL